MNDLSTKILVKRLAEYAQPFIPRMIFGFVCMILVAAATACSAHLIEPIINDIFIARDSSMLLPVTLSIFAVFLVKGLATYFESTTMAYVGYKIISALQKDLFSRLIKADLAFFHDMPTGDLISRFMSDVQKLNSAVTGTLSNIGKDFLMLIGLMFVMFYKDWMLACIVFFILPVAILPVVRIGRRMRKTSINIQEETAYFTVLLSQCFQGIRLVKSYCMELYEKSRVDAAIDIVFQRTLKGVKTKAFSHPVMEFLGGVAVATVVLYGGNEVINNNQNPGAFFSFITSLLMAYEPLKRLANLSANLQEQMAAAGRVFSILDHESKIKEKNEAQVMPVAKGDIQFSDVHFGYGDGLEVLKAINIKIPAGKTVAFVGTSGAGKSTLMNLIPRFYDVTQGKIQIDGENIQDVTFESLRKNIALVSQEVMLFDDTIRANIEYGKPGASDEEIKDAARAAAAHDFIEGLAEGYETIAGEQGVKLSGGQRQRIAIARAMLKDAPILMLDEPTSALDSKSEQIVQEALNTLMKGRTTLIIAHRLATVLDADMIFVMENGHIISSGTHVELLEKCERYAQLCKAQLRHSEQKVS